MKKTIAIISGIILMLGIAVMMTGCNKKTDETSDKNVTYKEVTVRELVEEIEEDAEAASKKYKDGHYKITGPIYEFDSNEKTLYLLDNKNEFDTTYVMCNIKNDKQIKFLKTLKEGHEVSVFGKITEVVTDPALWGYIVDVEYVVDTEAEK